MTELERLRHSCAHIMATAILRIWPDAQFAYGPPIETGFYYDLELDHRLSPEDFEKIEAEMKREVKANHRFERIEVSREQVDGSRKEARGRIQNGVSGDRAYSTRARVSSFSSANKR